MKVFLNDHYILVLFKNVKIEISIYELFFQRLKEAGCAHIDITSKSELYKGCYAKALELDVVNHEPTGRKMIVIVGKVGKLAEWADGNKLYRVTLKVLQNNY